MSDSCQAQIITGADGKIIKLDNLRVAFDGYTRDTKRTLAQTA
jgi:hypothetical protein